jgi:hypothetical protein
MLPLIGLFSIILNIVHLYRSNVVLPKSKFLSDLNIFISLIVIAEGVIFQTFGSAEGSKIYMRLKIWSDLKLRERYMRFKS